MTRSSNRFFSSSRISPSHLLAAALAVIFLCPIGGICPAIGTRTARADDAEGVLFSKQKEVPQGATEREVRLGDKAAAQLEKDPKIKFLDPAKDEASKALHEKLNAMAQALGKNSGRPKIVYKVKVIEDDEINAFTLPNGNIYFYRGLLDILGSDDEIAAVMAHEIGHNAEMHVTRGTAKANKLSLIGMAAMLAALAGGKSGADVALFSQYLLTGIINGYSIEYEKEADSSAVETMRKGGYNPSALATVMGRFEAEEKRRPKTDPGIYRTHPPSDERVQAIEKQIRAAGLSFNPRAVSGGASAIAVEGEGRVTVQFKKATLMEFAADAAPGQSILSARQRAEQAASIFNELLKNNLKLHELQIQSEQSGGQTIAILTARGTEITRVLPADAALQKMSVMECAQKWRANLGQIFWRETVNGAM